MCRNDGETKTRHRALCKGKDLYLAILLILLRIYGSSSSPGRRRRSGRSPVPAVPPDVPQLQRHLPLHPQLPVEVGDEQLRALVDVVVPRCRRAAAAGRRPLQLLGRRRGGAVGPRQAPGGRRAQARRPGRPGAGGRGRRRDAVLDVQQARPRVEAEAPRRRRAAAAGQGPQQHPPRRAEGEQEPDLGDRLPEAPEDRRRRPLLGLGRLLLHGWVRDLGDDDGLFLPCSGVVADKGRER